MALQKDISFYRGEDVQLNGQMDPVENITGWAITFTMRSKATDPDPPSLVKTVGSGITITDGPGGSYTVAILDTDTTGLTAGSYVYDIKRTDEGQEAILSVGVVILKQEVTR